MNIADEFININATARKLSMNPLQVLFDREEEFSDRLNSRATFYGFTALHYAVLGDKIELIRTLLESGADPLIENDLGHRAYEYCSSDEVKGLIESYEKKAFDAKESKMREERRKFPLEQRIKQKIIGQDAAIQTTSSVIRRKENGWFDEEVIFIQLVRKFFYLFICFLKSILW